MYLMFVLRPEKKWERTQRDAPIGHDPAKGAA
jgi:hypothetical protein